LPISSSENDIFDFLVFFGCEG